MAHQFQTAHRSAPVYRSQLNSILTDHRGASMWHMCHSLPIPQPQQTLLIDHSTHSWMQLQIPSQHIQILPKSDWACKMTTICYSWFSFSSRILWSWPFWFCAELLIWAIHSTPFPLYPAWKVFQEAELTCVYQGRGGGRGKGSPSTGFLARKREKHNPAISKKEKTKSFFPHPVLFMKSLHPLAECIDHVLWIFY